MNKSGNFCMLAIWTKFSYDIFKTVTLLRLFVSNEYKNQILFFFFFLSLFLSLSLSNFLFG